MPAASAGWYAVCIDVLEARLLLTSDFGDAPDATAGTKINDYQTLAANGGPSHVIDSTRNTLARHRGFAARLRPMDCS
ncbi:MAG TPA: hypothetical protein PK992_05865, partial [Planctomycetaceae bacterium]|nr:hypothetical protein [Planctomycetaceae bacterium]